MGSGEDVTIIASADDEATATANPNDRTLRHLKHAYARPCSNVAHLQDLQNQESQKIHFNDGSSANFTTDLLTILKWFDAGSVGAYFNSEIKGR